MSKLLYYLYKYMYISDPMSFSPDRSSGNSFVLPSSLSFLEVSSENFSSDTATITSESCSTATASITSKSHCTNPESPSECSSHVNHEERAFVSVP